MPTERQILARERQRAKERFRVARVSEREYMARLTGVGREVGKLINGFMTRGGEITDPQALQQSLTSYSITLRPWAAAVGETMIARVDSQNYTAWKQLSKSIGSNLAKEIDYAPVGVTMRRLLGEQIHYITSIPTDAAERVHALTLEGLLGGRRAEDIRRDILRSSDVSVSKAQLIARTEVARTASILTQSRAEYIGSTGYWWRTMRDSDVRSLHKQLAGTFHKWDDPPVAGERGEKAHAGQIYNCRCYPEPEIPDL